MTGTMERVRPLFDRFTDSWAAPAYLVICLAAGGGTGSAIPNAVLQLVGVALLAWLFARGALADIPREARPVIIITIVTVGLLLASLIPLPPAIWALLPGRAPIAAGYGLLGLAQPWMPVSLAPTATMAAVLGVIPPAAVLMSVLVAAPRGRFFAVLALGLMAVASTALGVQQQLTGWNSAWYLYQQTSHGGAVGFFANRNHLATLFLMTLPLIAALAASAERVSGRERRLGQRLMAFAALALVVVGLVFAQSVAGWLLLLPTLVGCFLVYRANRTRSMRVTMAVGESLLVLGVALAMFAPIAGDWLQEKGEMRPRERRESMQLTFRAALDYLPVGSGAGSFVRTYPAFEAPSHATPTFVNHAHNDYVELLLETGVSGFLLLGAFVLWWARRTATLWKGDASRTLFGRAGAVSLALLFGHSFVDFPFRTSAIAAVAALATGLMIAPLVLVSRQRRRSEDDDQGEREISLASSPVATARSRPAVVRRR